MAFIDTASWPADTAESGEPAMVEMALKTVLLIVLAALATSYARGWHRLGAIGYAPPIWRPVVYALGLLTVAAALLSPLDDLAVSRFSAHMAQHLLLTMMAAPLLLLGNPLPLILWGVPPGLRRGLAMPFRRDARSRSALSALTFWPAAGFLHVASVWVWHLPVLYDAAAEHELVHAVEHVTFFATALLFWWPIIRPAPRLGPRLHPGLQIAYLLAATAQSTALGMLLAVPERAFYPHYARIAATLGISAVEDQMLGGGLMWSGAHMYLLPILMILYGVSRDAARGRDDAPA
jgi:putative membrane protein